MVRTRIHEAAVVGVLSALATFCALEARGGQPSTVVGQSTAKTASTGKRPLAERIKAANRPIRITAEAELAPDEGLIRDLSAGDGAEMRDWPVVVPSVELAESDASLGEADGPQPAGEPAAVPPPGDDAVAANPTTADDAGMVGEVAGIDAAAEGDEPDATTADSIVAEAPAAPRPVPQVRQAPPRRAVARVTPQRRDALLGRLRAALAEMPRPFGLLPADEPRPAPRMNRPQPTRRPAPIAAAEVPPALEPAPGVSVDDVATDGATDGATDDLAAAPQERSASDPTVAADLSPDEPTLVDATPVDDAVAATDGATDGATAAATDVAAVDAAPEIAAQAAEAGDQAPSTADATAHEGTGDEATASPDTLSTTELPAPATTVATPHVAPGTAPRPAMRQPAPRTRAPSSIVQRPRPFERLQATFDAMPRPLGILPAPRPEMHAARGHRRTGAAPQAAMARTTTRPPAPAGAPRDPAVPESSAVAETTVAEPDGAVAGPESVADAGESPAAESAGTETTDALASTELPASAADGEPGAFPTEESNGPDGASEGVACIEVTVEGPDGVVERGSDVTLHLTVRNTGTVAARAVMPVFHFGRTIEPKAIAGREGTLTEQGTVVVEALSELGPGESIDVEVVATCHEVGTALFQGVVWCGEGETAEQVPVDGELRVVPARIATAPEGRSRR